MDFFVVLFLFVFGLIIGSFLNVVIYRTTHNQSFMRGRSMCPNCKKKIRWYDNVPVLSFLVLQGKCRWCKHPISWRYPAIELLTALLFVWWYMIGFTFFKLTQTPLIFVQPIFWLLVGIFLLIIFVTDWLYMIIPDYAVIALGILALAYRFYLYGSGVMQGQDLVNAILTGFVLMAFLFSLWYFTKGRGMGFGDVKYVLVMGWLLGWPRSLIAILLAFLMGAIFGIMLIIFKGKSLRAKIPFGPFLVLATAIALIIGGPLWEWYMGLLY